MDAATNLETLGRIPIDLRIGVTGHRWIPSDDKEIRATVHTTLIELRNAANASTDATPVGCTVVSSLAEGADRIVAHVGLALGARLEVVLPLQVTEYKKDFESERSQAEFDQLLDRAATVEVVGDAPSRPESYLAAGRGVADRVDVLVAIWDGAPSAGPGGTAEIIDYAKQLDLPVRFLLAERGPNVTIEGTWSTGPSIGPLTPAAFDRLDQHNRTPLSSKEQRAVRAELQKGEHPEWVPYYLRADQLALRYQHMHRLVVRLLYVLAVLAVVVVSGQLVFLSTHPGLAWIEFADLGLLVAALILARRSDLLGRWTSARFVAERLRSAMFLADVGATPSFALQPSGSADVWVRADWAGRAMRELWFRTPRDDTSATPEEAIRRIETGWITPQLGYHETALNTSLRRQRVASITAIVLFALSMVAAVLHTFDVEGDTEYWAFVSIVVPTAAAAISGYAAQREFGRQVLRSRQVIRDLQAVRRALEAAPSTQGVQVVAAQIDALVHSDAAEWFVTATLHEPELP